MYGIGAAARLSGVHAETIRMWERRHNLPSPQRSEGGHRQYSERDVALVRAIKRLLDGGARIGSVAEMSEDEIFSAAAGLADAREGNWNEAIARTIEAAKKRDPHATEELLDRPLLQRHALDVITAFYLPLLARVGELWQAGALDIATEHALEKLVSGRIHSVLANLRSVQGAPRAVCACPAGERHEVGLLAATVVLKDAGFAVVHLGADVPTSALALALEVQPRLLVLACTIVPLPAVISGLVQLVAAHPEVMVIVGGAGAAPLQKALGRRARRCADLTQLLALARAILSS